MAERFIIDTSAVIKYLNETLQESGLLFIDNIIDAESVISFITQIELQSWSSSNPDDINSYQAFVFNSSIIGIDQDIIRETVRIRKNFKLKLPDALIAATAIVKEITLVADNDKDFKKVMGLKYLNPNKITDSQSL